MRVEGVCPMGCGETLETRTARRGGAWSSTVWCANQDCPDALMAHKVLASDTDHVVTCREEGFAITHPLRERFTDMTECDLHVTMRKIGPTMETGRWRATPADGEPGNWNFYRLET